MNNNRKAILLICISIMYILSAGCVSDDDIVDVESKIQTQTVESESVTTEFIETNQTSATTSSVETTSEFNEASEIVNLITHYSQDDIPDFMKEVNWNEDMVMNSDEEKEEYIDQCISQSKTQIAYILKGNCDEQEADSSLMKLGNGIIASLRHQAVLKYGDVEATYVMYEVGYFTSKYILDAYESGDTSNLSPDNLAVYNKSVEFINTIDKSASDISKERQIHDYICNLTTYYNNEEEFSPDNLPRYRMAVGVMLDGSANCMGYTDAFYMLSRMAGFETEKVNSDESMKHTWNVITLSGKKYVVDVTWDDEALMGSNGQAINGYMYFNAPIDVISQEYRYDYNDIFMKSVVPTVDENYYYCLNSSDYGYMTYSYDEFYNKVVELINNGEKSFFIACKNTVAGSTQEMLNRVIENLTAGSISGSLHNMSGYSFAYICFTP